MGHGGAGRMYGSKSVRYRQLCEPFSVEQIVLHGKGGTELLDGNFRSRSDFNRGGVVELQGGGPDKGFNR